ncbi:1-phosphatidylinositol 4-5-bisphosphate phosphodiesterase classes I and II isoform X1 [Brachionus plicatilis]|uniref:1-phosphatidylinositol 4-5-bisphosphate phosphodiesterase classes I and II isoform X1 n=1 Tax=Brachionus plicatilis TaxID=10195 RepID=A0A3M7P736_BRAPC|nr:1-phosphatidylinositol 4-5-bisphosphate phosphodiesterase classes I and II isoform X1 [Brachionus plicatilis]
MQLNLGKFEYSNRCGYLLKPELMRRMDVSRNFDPLTENPIDGIVASTLSIRIISGIFLNHVRSEEKRTGYSVTVEMYGLPADSVRGQKAHRVKALSSKYFSVIYSDPCGYRFKKIIMPELALLKITAFDDQAKQIGQRILPVVGLKPGFRFICLKNESNQQLLMSSLFVNIQLGDYIPEEYEEFASALVNPISFVSKLTKDEIVKNLTDDTNEVARHNLNYLQESSSKENVLYDLEDEPEVQHNKISKSVSNLINLIDNDLKFLNCESMANLNPRENRYSISCEKYNQIRKSDLLNTKLLSSSMFNIPRSQSLFFNDYESLEKTKRSFSLLNDPTLFAEIDLEDLIKMKNNQNILQNCGKKCQRLEKEAEKKIKELNENLILELDRQRTDHSKQKLKPDKKRKLFALKTSRSSIDFDVSLKNMNLTTTEKYVNRMKVVYEETYVKIRNLRLVCLQTLYIRLEKTLAEIQESRMQQLKIRSEKENSLVNKQTHQLIKSKKKLLSETVQDKEEFARLARKIEKESVLYAVNESSKLDELMKITETSMKSLKEYKEKQLLLYKNELVDKLNQKKLDLDKKYLFNSALDPDAAINSLYSLHLSKSAGVLNHVANEPPIERMNKKETHLSSGENITRFP